MSEFDVPSVRVASDLTEEGFIRINAADFEHGKHKLVDEGDAHLIPAPKVIGAASPKEADDLLQKISDLEDQVLEALSERDEWKARAEAAEAAAKGQPVAEGGETAPAAPPKPRGKPGPKAK